MITTVIFLFLFMRQDCILFEDNSFICEKERTQKYYNLYFR